MIQLDNKIAVVTGGTRGIGKAIVKALSQAGAKVHYTGRSEDSIAKAAQDFKSEGIEAVGHVAQITETDKATELIKSIIKTEGRIDILVNNAGITQDNLFMKMSFEQFDSVIQTNLGGSFTMSKAVIRAMIKAKSGRIINIGSVVGSTGNPGQVNYCASKAGLEGFTKALAKEVASRNITCNLIAPGFIETDMTSELNPDQQQAIVGQIPAGRMGAAKDIADAVLFLASDMASYITGASLHVNGGMHCD